jgi:hypothetical protein
MIITADVITANTLAASTHMSLKFRIAPSDAANAQLSSDH